MVGCALNLTVIMAVAVIRFDLDRRNAVPAGGGPGAVLPDGCRRDVKTHCVVVGDAKWPLELWHTHCGWKFGKVRHLRTHRELANCERCLRRVSD